MEIARIHTNLHGKKYKSRLSKLYSKNKGDNNLGRSNRKML
jgi:hypothetical protein